MTSKVLTVLFERDLDKLISEIESFSPESALWKTQGAITNPAGTLALHIAGNLQHFIGAALGKSGYTRNRDEEFAARDVPATEIINRLRAALDVVKKVLPSLTDSDLEKIFPLEKHGEKVTTLYMLLHLLTHLNYHLGQVNYLRRIVS